MLMDPFQRRIHYLRLSVTDKCNLRCTYCRPAEGVKLVAHEDILSLEEIYGVAAHAVDLGIDKIRLTGGEPLVRKNVEFLVEMIGGLPGLRDLSMTTNGVALSSRASTLKARGLHRVNISLDTLQGDRYRAITRGGEIADALRGIDAALDAGLTPVKINAVVIPGVNEDEREAFLEFGERKGVEVRFIRRMNLTSGERYGVDGSTTVGQCELCNRLRLTCTGDLKPCLFSACGFNVRNLGVERAFELALRNKPERGQTNTREPMYHIGG